MRSGLLLVMAAVWGTAGAWLFRRFTSPVQVRAVMSQMVAHILELQLFVDEPRLIFRAQRDLLFANFRLLRLGTLPMLLLAIPFAALYVPLNRYFGAEPLTMGQVAIAEVASTSANLTLAATAEVRLESPGLRIPLEHATLWRVRATSNVTHSLRASDGSSVTLHTASARFFGMPWAVFFAVWSTVAGLAAHVLLQKLHAFKRD